MIKIARCCFVTLLLLGSLPTLYAQTIITGSVSDEETGETIIGAKVMVMGKVIGTVTDPVGHFSLSTTMEPPFMLQISALGYEERELEIVSTISEFAITLPPKIFAGDEVVLSASRIEEEILEAPISIYKMGLSSIRFNPSADLVDGLAHLKEVQINKSSFTFNSINTRGFADAQNFRFIQRIDGMEMNFPGLNYAAGNFNGSSELDLRGIEVVPGAGSALYGPNAFNGIMNMYTKSPFEYPGLSAFLKSGVSVQEGVKSRPFSEAGVRYAKILSPKFAIKLNVSALYGYEWEANDESYHITPSRIPLQDELLSLSRTDPNFDAVNVYGDEVQVGVDLGGEEPVLINRTGIQERDIVDYEIQHYRVHSALHYKLNEKMEAIYGFRYSRGDAILRHTTVYPFVNASLFTHRLELKGNNFFVRGYYSGENARDSYAMVATGAFIQEGLRPSNLWSQDYGRAFRGEIPGVVGNNHTAARNFADRDQVGPESPLFQRLRTQTLGNPNINTGGSKFIENSNFLHGEAMYDFRSVIDWVDLQVGGSMRQYALNSEGQLFNDGANGFNAPIQVWEVGAYAQASRSLWEDHVRLRASVRYDRNVNFQGQITPRGSVVFAFGNKHKHRFRFSAQTGFRNPSSQESYIALDVRDAILLGGVEDNILTYNYKMADGTRINGQRIYDSFVTLNSAIAFQQGGGTNPELLRPANLEPLRQERLSTAEAGYKAIFSDRFWVDMNMYYNIYEDFVQRINVFSPLANRVFSVYSNVEQQINSIGGGVGLNYLSPGGYQIGGNVSVARFDADNAIAANPGFLPAFNTPEYKGSVWLENRDVYKGIGFSVQARMAGDYLWQSPFGQGEIPAYTVVDGSVSFRSKEIKALIKVGGSNLLNQPYRVMYGGPQIGAQYFVSLTFDPFIQ